MSTNKAQVLIVGAGPVGLMVANELLRKNVTVRIIDQSPTPSPVTISKALAIHARTLEILDEIGIIQEFLDRSIKVKGLKTYDENNKVLMNVDFNVIKDSKYPFIISLPQGVTEDILRKKLESSGVHVDRNLSVRGLVQDQDGVNVTIENVVDKTTETSRYEYVVGADGAHSAIRKLLGLTFEGEKYDANMSLCDVTVDWDLEPNFLHTWGAGTFMLGAIPIPGDRRYRIILDEFSNHVENTSGVEHGLISGSPVEVSHFEKFFSQVYPKAKLIDMTWSTKFNISHRLVNKWHVGRTFVAGDAAHIHSPVGGQGMNTGLCDAYNLAWKLSLVIHGTSPSSILDSYDSERSHAASVVVATTDKSTKMMTIENPLAQQVRNKVMGFLTSFEYVQSSLAHTTAQLVQNYATCKSPIIASDKGWFHGSTTTVVAGWRALDVELADGSTLLSHVWNGRENKHTALFVLNIANLNSAKFDEIERIALQVAHRYNEGVQVVICLPEQAKEYSNVVKSPIKAIYDKTEASETVFSVYGVSTDESAIYLIRPDGYVGFATKPATADKVLSYLQTIFIRK